MGLDLAKLLKIAALVNDASTDEATREVALLRLEEARRRDPEGFRAALAQISPPPPRAAPKSSTWNDVAEAPEPRTSADPEYLSFFDLGDWGRSSRNADNLVHTLADDTLVTIFANRRYPGRFAWSVLWDGRDAPVFSHGAFPSEIAAMRDCWTNEIAPKRRRGRT
jgi:hypothetical protein